MSISKVIHYCWFGRNPLPESVQMCIASWKKYCPDYEIIQWNEDNFDFSVCPYAAEAYKIKKWSFVSDYVRFKVIYDFGGVYLDTDVELIKSIDPLLEYPAFLGFESDYTVASGLGFGAVKGHPFIAENIKAIMSMPLYVNGEINPIIAPKITTNILKEHGLVSDCTKMQTVADVVILPKEYLCPKDFETEKTKITRNTYSIHHYDASWFSEERRIAHERAVKQRRIEKRFGKRLGKYIYRISLTFAYLFKEGGCKEILRKKLHRS